MRVALISLNQSWEDKKKNLINFAVGDACFDYVIGCAMLIKRDFFLVSG